MNKHITILLTVFCLLTTFFIGAEAYEDMPTKGNALKHIQLSKPLKEFYAMFQCACCGKPIDTNCCGMARQRKAYADDLLLKNVEVNEKEVMYQMAKKFGFDVIKDPASQQEVRVYIKSQAPENPAQIEIEPHKIEMGTVNQKDGIVSTMFTLKNTGASDLIVENLDTSCGCTSVSIIYNGQEGPKFTMAGHGENPANYRLQIPPGESAQLRVEYDPMAHGEQKEPNMKIIREITVISNDPVDFQKTVRIELTQVP